MCRSWIAATKVDKNEMKMATMLVEQMVTTLSEIDTVDQYHQALRKLIDSKIKGKKVVEFEVEEVPRLDIMSALKKSLQQSNRKPMVKATAGSREEEVADAGEVGTEGKGSEETEGFVMRSVLPVRSSDWG